jgi:UDP-2,3-diacylglucosamine pyrophosphatase LpxH
VRAYIDPRRLAAVGRGVDLVVAGHIHRQVSLTARGARLQLCGDWGPQGGAWLVGYADGRLIPCTGRFPT